MDVFVSIEDKQSIAGSNGVMNGGTAVNNGELYRIVFEKI